MPKIDLAYLTEYRMEKITQLKIAQRPQEKYRLEEWAKWVLKAEKAGCVEYEGHILSKIQTNVRHSYIRIVPPSEFCIYDDYYSRIHKADTFTEARCVVDSHWKSINRTQVG